MDKATLDVEAPKKGTQDRQITMRLPSSLLDVIDGMAEGNGQGRSDVIRAMLRAFVSMTIRGLTEEQSLVFKQGFLSYLTWINDPVESFMYKWFRTTMAAGTPEILRPIAVMMAESVIRWGNIGASLAEEQGLTSLMSVLDVSDLDPEVIADNFVTALQRFDLNKTPTQEFYGETADEEEEEEQETLGGKIKRIVRRNKA